ncbi:unnamed protein product [Cuscuta campestris]|uniref:Uncharacterized protein n=2 Tax=Cuscuta sect. Cleistogrammica TaxID=1824901 RepID=A0A484K2F8_9ASTE|nr:hypothetical protein DM860_011906 [Cuscuta australis]VFQ59640.1 unnamed protein product [Cuscuta campestris]VFQ73921.1 unnamed protein product [Cuscuta campestris]
METVKSLAERKPVVIFSIGSRCSMSHTIETLVAGFGGTVTVHELDVMPNGKNLEWELMQGIWAAASWASRRKPPSLPAVFIGGEYVGGEGEIMCLHLKGELVPLLKKARAIWL